MRDQIAVPGAHDVRAVLREASAQEGATFMVAADVKKAHRRVRHRAEDWPLLACRTRVGGDIWVHRVGTFGLTSASYWWSRLAGALGRLVMHILGPDEWLQMLIFVDDLLFLAKGPGKFEAILLCLLLWTLMGTPFSWRKLRGGLKLQWIGYALCSGVRPHGAGLSDERAAWLSRWGREMLRERLVQVGVLQQGLGRLSFAAGLLDWSRPFLAPI
eukprot:6475264-Amphidinium_carterae.2